MPELNMEKRDALGTRQVSRLRKKGKIPGIIYGHGRDSMPVVIDKHEMELALLHGERLLEVNVGDAKENVLIKDVQYDTFGQTILHVDLARVDLNERVEVTVAVVLRGTPAGIADGGMLQQTLTAVKLECVVTAIPDDITVPVTEMKIGDSLHAGDLPLPEGAILQGDPQEVVCSVVMVAEEAEEVEATEEREEEPEVIGEKKEPEEGDEASTNE